MAFWDLSRTEEVFIYGTAVLLPIIIPLSLGLFIWFRAFNRSPHITSLGLDESSTPSEYRTVSWFWRVVYALTITVTFFVGLLTFKVFQVVQEIFTSLTR